jgi:hypothetical protein
MSATGKNSGTLEFSSTLFGAIQELNKPLLGNAFCPLIGRKGASARVSSCSRKLGGL